MVFSNRRLGNAGLVVAGAFAALFTGAAAPQSGMSANDFVGEAAQSDLYEIQASRVVLTQSTDPRVRGFAQEMIEDHQRTSDGLRKAAAASGLAPPPMALSGDERSLLSALQSLKGSDLDKTFAVQQVNAHRAALATQQTYLAAGSDLNLRGAAQSAVPIIEHHLQMAEQLKVALGAN